MHSYNVTAGCKRRCRAVISRHAFRTTVHGANHLLCSCHVLVFLHCHHNFQSYPIIENNFFFILRFTFTKKIALVETP